MLKGVPPRSATSAREHKRRAHEGSRYSRRNASSGAAYRPSPLRTNRETWLRSGMSLALIRSAPAVELNSAQMLAVEHGIGDAGRSRAVARHRRRRLRQDGDARASGCGADPRRRRSEAHHAGDVLAPRRSRARPARRAAARPPSRARSRGRSDARLFGHVPCDRRAAPARIRAAPRARSAVHHPRPRGFRGPHELGAARGRPHRDEGALSDQGDMPCDLFARRQRAGRPRPDHRQMVPLGRGARGGSSRAVWRLRRGETASERARLRRPPALFRPDAGGAGDRRRSRRALRSSPRRRISGHQCAAGRDRARA